MPFVIQAWLVDCVKGSAGSSCMLLSFSYAYAGDWRNRTIVDVAVDYLTEVRLQMPSKVLAEESFVPANRRCLARPGSQSYGAKACFPKWHRDMVVAADERIVKLYFLENPAMKVLEERESVKVWLHMPDSVLRSHSPGLLIWQSGPSMSR